MKKDEPTISDSLRALADEGHPHSDALRQEADEFEAAIISGDAKKILDVWDRICRLWYECTGKRFMFNPPVK